MNASKTLVAAALLAIPFSTLARDAPRYIAREVDGFTLYDVNDSNELAGEGFPPTFSGQYAVFVDRDGQLRNLGALGGPASLGYRLNDGGQVTGWLYVAVGSPDFHAFVSGRDGGTLKDLGTLGGANSEGLAINDHGQVTGWASVESGNSHAFIADGNGDIIDLGTLGGADSIGTGINDRGEVVGYSDT